MCGVITSSPSLVRFVRWLAKQNSSPTNFDPLAPLCRLAVRCYLTQNERVRSVASVELFESRRALLGGQCRPLPPRVRPSRQ
eukprot:6392606-Prymnesium_polylepis.1